MQAHVDLTHVLCRQTGFVTSYLHAAISGCAPRIFASGQLGTRMIYRYIVSDKKCFCPLFRQQQFSLDIIYDIVE